MKTIHFVLFFFNLLGLYAVFARGEIIDDFDGKRMDEKVEEALDIYKYSVLIESFKKLERNLDEGGVNLDAVEGPLAASREDFVRILLDCILKGKRSFEIKEWANREQPDSHYVGGKKEFEMVVVGGVVRECRSINRIISILQRLDTNPDLRSKVSEDTLRYWRIMKVCAIIDKGQRNGDLIDDLYKELQVRVKKRRTNIMNIISTFRHPFQGKTYSMKKAELSDDEEIDGLEEDYGQIYENIDE